ncbi:unnamed protein product [Cylindrotheca closterium]|uniref:Uncharacterized protein n=1 Tax=Cylindrotheca closterium TaxID=2856 RepID=A0AAD2CWJ1_9STRA|nr:unnamed protein product [Cylindrotheca closterium]
MCLRSARNQSSLEHASCKRHFCLVASKKFSSMVNKLVVVVGGDKDEGQTAVMERYANRKGGNCADHVSPIAYLEKGAENYHNLAISFLRPGSPPRKYLQLLLNNGLFPLCVNMTDPDGKIVDSQCVFLNLFPGAEANEMLPLIELNLHDCDDRFVLRELHKVTVSGMKCIGLDLWNARLWRNKRKFIVFELVFDIVFAKTMLKKFTGIAFIWVGWTMLERSMSTQNHFAAVGIMSCDKKHAWIASGMQDSWNQHCSCICCTQPNITYIANPPDWLLSKQAVADSKDYPLRMGRFSTKKLHKKYVEKAEGKPLSAAQLKAIKIECTSVHHDPILYMHPSKVQNGGLRISSGIINHMKDGLDGGLSAIDNEVIEGETTWMQNVEETKKDCKPSKDDDQAYKDLRTESLEIYRRIKSLKYTLSPKGRRYATMTDETLQSTRDQIAELESLPVIVECNTQNQLRITGKHLVERIDAKGKAQYTFRVAIQHTGCTFQAQHGGMEL